MTKIFYKYDEDMEIQALVNAMFESKDHFEQRHQFLSMQWKRLAEDAEAASKTAWSKITEKLIERGAYKEGQTPENTSLTIDREVGCIRVMEEKDALIKGILKDLLIKSMRE